MQTLEAINALEVIRSGETVLLDVYADWCGPCKAMTPILEEVDEEVNDVTVVKVDADQSVELLREWGIQSIPTMILFVDGEEEGRIVGAVSKDKLTEFLSG